MPVSKETESLLRKEISELKIEETEQQRVVDALTKKKDESILNHGQAQAKLTMIQNTIKAYEKDMGRDANP